MPCVEVESMPNAPALVLSLRGMPLFAGVADARLEELARAAYRRTAARGEALFCEGEAPDRVVVITRGLVKVVRHAPDGSENIMGLFGPRDAVGLIAVLEHRPFPATAIALTDAVETICLSASHMLDMMNEDASVAMAASRCLARQAASLIQKIDIITAGQVAQRLAVLLGGLAEHFGDEQEDGSTFVPVALTRGELACLVGARVETTIRALSGWQKAGWLETTREGFVVRDLDALARAKAPDDGELGEAPRPRAVAPLTGD